MFRYMLVFIRFLVQLSNMLKNARTGRLCSRNFQMTKYFQKASKNLFQIIVKFKQLPIHLIHEVQILVSRKKTQEPNER